MATALKFRNIEASPDDPVETWPFEGILAAVEREPSRTGVGSRPRSVRRPSARAGYRTLIRLRHRPRIRIISDTLGLMTRW